MSVAGYLLIAGSPDVARVCPITDDRLIVGRDTECHLRLVFPTISRTHCAIWEEDGKLVVEDLKSSGGTYVNGTRVKRRRLQFGDLVQVGPLVMQVLRGHQPFEAVFETGMKDAETADWLESLRELASRMERDLPRRASEARGDA